MTALISCKKTNQRLTEFLVASAGIEAGMEYNTQVYANAVRPIQASRLVDALKEADQAKRNLTVTHTAIKFRQISYLGSRGNLEEQELQCARDRSILSTSGPGSLEEVHAQQVVEAEIVIEALAYIKANTPGAAPGGNAQPLIQPTPTAIQPPPALLPIQPTPTAIQPPPAFQLPVMTVPPPARPSPRPGPSGRQPPVSEVCAPASNQAFGVVVMFNEDKFKSTRNQWDVGCIISVTRGADNQARRAVVAVERPQNKEGQYDLVTHDRAVSKLVPIDLIADQIKRILPVDITKYPKADLVDDEHPQPQRDDPTDYLERPPDDLAVKETPSKSTSDKVNTQKVPIAIQHQGDNTKSMIQQRISSSPNHGD
jgi:hypothetical protein